MSLNAAPRHLLRRATAAHALRPSALLAAPATTPHRTPPPPSLRRPHHLPLTATASFTTTPHPRLFIQTENTPNPDALKFKPQTRILPPSFPSSFLEYLSARATVAPPHPSPLAAQLFAVEGVTAVFYGADYITVTKDSAAAWGHVKPEVFALITEAVTSGAAIVTTSAEGSSADGEGAEADEGDTLAVREGDSEVVAMVKELLDTRIRPAIQEDGGDIEFRGMQDGWVLLKLRGACRTCDSSTVTLRNGIEGMLQHYIEEVKGVQQVMDQEEEVAMQEFAKFEEKLRQSRGEAPANAPLDQVAG